MPPETFAPAMGPVLPASRWLSWAPEVVEAVEPFDTDGFDWLGGALCLVMWGCASVMAVWYL